MLKYSKITVCSGLRWGFKFYGMYSTVLPHNLNKKNKKINIFDQLKMRIVEANRGKWVKMLDFGHEKTTFAFLRLEIKKGVLVKNLESPLIKLCLVFLSHSDLNPYVRSNLIIVLRTLEK